MDTHPGITALTRAQERWNAGDLNGYLALYRSDVKVFGYAGVEPGFENLKRFYEGFWAAFPGSRLVFEDVFTSADKVTCRFIAHGKHTGNFQGMPPTQREFSLPGITILRFVGNQCVERWSQADFLSLLQQLGAIPA
jgi:predicted ester cyclase